MRERAANDRIRLGCGSIEATLVVWSSAPEAAQGADCSLRRLFGRRTTMRDEPV